MSVDTTYLGRLLQGKPLPDGTRFMFIVNETPQRDLHEFGVERNQPRGPVSAAVRDDAISRLNGLSLPDGRDVAWCIDRLDVLVEARTVEYVEGEALQRLAAACGDVSGREGPPVPASLHVVAPAAATTGLENR